MSVRTAHLGPADADRGTTWRQSDRSLRSRLTVVRETLDALLTRLREPAPALPPATDDLHGAVTGLTGACVAAGAVPGLAPEDHEGLRRLLLLLQKLGADVFQHELRLLPRRLEDCDAALTRLRTLPTSNDLLDHVCEELVLRCGFGRAVLSRVDGAMWKPWMAHFGSGDVDDQWFTAWVDRPIPLADATVESQILAERRPAAVYDTQSADVHRPIIVDAGHSSSYVVAPIIVADVVIGFLHADYDPIGRRVDNVDRDVLWAFSQGFAQLYERAVLRERLVEQRERMRQVLAASDELLADRGCELVVAGGQSGGAGRPVPSFGPGSAIEQLTERESEVLALVAVGATNQQIAQQLVVAESTVKTHVKHILRKLGVANRAQAISQFLSA
ncbi:MAG: modulated transcriptional regulator, LuxR family [Frankiales bacterium]|nr:modulated transcriptional regulator, LuxR family [Frankiales bacterium]